MQYCELDPFINRFNNAEECRGQKMKMTKVKSCIEWYAVVIEWYYVAYSGVGGMVANTLFTVVLEWIGQFELYINYAVE